MGLFDLLKSKPNGNKPHDQMQKIALYEYPVASFQNEYVTSELSRINELLKNFQYTRNLQLNTELHPTYMFIFEPYTEKTGKISKYPCILSINAVVYMGYSARIYYDTNDMIGKAKVTISNKKYSFTIDIKGIDGTLEITKVIATDDARSYKVYHKMQDGSIITEKLK